LIYDQTLLLMSESITAKANRPLPDTDGCALSLLEQSDDMRFPLSEDLSFPRAGFPVAEMNHPDLLRIHARH
jgi:hypothetical protein